MERLRSNAQHRRRTWNGCWQAKFPKSIAINVIGSWLAVSDHIAISTASILACRMTCSYSFDLLTGMTSALSNLPMAQSSSTVRLKALYPLSVSIRSTGSAKKNSSRQAVKTTSTSLPIQLQGRSFHDAKAIPNARVRLDRTDRLPDGHL